MAVLICGVKASHDAGVAVIDDGRLLFSVELEKLDNNVRYSYLGDLRRVTDILVQQGVPPEAIDQFVVDGWYTPPMDADKFVSLQDGDRSVDLRVAPYLEFPGDDRGPLQRHVFDSHHFSGSAGYASYTHVANHLIGGYCSSPFAAGGEDALVLVWDGGVVPRLYHVRAGTRAVTMVAALLPLIGNCFADFSAQFDPFTYSVEGMTVEAAVRKHLSVAGKAMAYAALGKVEPDAYPLFDDLLGGFLQLVDETVVTARLRDVPREAGAKIAANRDELAPGLSNADLIATFQAYLGDRLLTRLATEVERAFPGTRPNLVMAGGCALNIKWNTLIRSSGLFREVFIPPFPNDAGAALGTAACEMFQRGRLALDWELNLGPAITTGMLPAGWRAQPCDERQVAALLHGTGEPVVVLSGRAELVRAPSATGASWRRRPTPP